MDKKNSIGTHHPDVDHEAPAASTRKGLVNWLFDPETRLGRFNRSTLRTLAIILSFFAVGLAVGYITLYRPAQHKVDQLQTDLMISSTSLKAQLASANADASALKASLDTANQRYEVLTGEKKKLQGDLDQANRHIQVLQFLEAVQAAQAALSANDANTARNLLLDSRNQLLKLAPVIEGYKAELSKNMQAHYDLALGKVDSDVQGAMVDLKFLLEYLQAMEKEIF